MAPTPWIAFNSSTRAKLRVGRVCPMCKGTGNVLGRWTVDLGGRSIQCRLCFGWKWVERGEIKELGPSLEEAPEKTKEWIATEQGHKGQEDEEKREVEGAAAPRSRSGQIVCPNCTGPTISLPQKERYRLNDSLIVAHRCFSCESRFWVATESKVITVLTVLGKLPEGAIAEDAALENEGSAQQRGATRGALTRLKKWILG